MNVFGFAEEVSACSASTEKNKLEFVFYISNTSYFRWPKQPHQAIEEDHKRWHLRLARLLLTLLDLQSILPIQNTQLPKTRKLVTTQFTFITSFTHLPGIPCVETFSIAWRRSASRFLSPVSTGVGFANPASIDAFWDAVTSVFVSVPYTYIFC